jgi:hypothetical protein
VHPHPPFSGRAMLSESESAATGAVLGARPVSRDGFVYEGHLVAWFVLLGAAPAEAEKALEDTAAASHAAGRVAFFRVAGGGSFGLFLKIILNFYFVAIVNFFPRHQPSIFFKFHQ